MGGYVGSCLGFCIRRNVSQLLRLIVAPRRWSVARIPDLYPPLPLTCPLPRQVGGQMRSADDVALSSRPPAPMHLDAGAQVPDVVLHGEAESRQF